VITRQIKVFEAMVDSPGTHLEIVNEAILSNAFKGVTLHPGCKSDVGINTKQLFRSFADMKNRLLACNASNMSSTGSEVGKPTIQYHRLLESLQVLYPINWPVARDIRYGEKEVVELADRFRIDSRSTVRAFRAFVEADGKIIPEDLKALLSAVGTIPVSTAECERGFSVMNLIITPARNSLSTPNVSALLFVKLVGPPLSKFEPLKYVKSWLSKGHHMGEDTNSRGIEKKEMRNCLDHLWKFL